MVQRWYDEVKNYDFDKGGPKAASGAYKHFSQLIWANTAELGVGTAVSKRYGFITVARYRPTGNDGGIEEFIRNVPPEGGNMYLKCKNIWSYVQRIRRKLLNLMICFISREGFLSLKKLEKFFITS